ncbi:MAG: putative signal transducing protein [Actinomycetota bacterium]
MRRDAMVAVFRGPSPEAQIIRSLIEANEIRCFVSVDSAGGEAPSSSWGARVLVRREDEALARRVIAEAEPIPGV